MVNLSMFIKIHERITINNYFYKLSMNNYMNNYGYEVSMNNIE